MSKERLEEIEDRFYKTGYEINTASPEPQQIRADLHHLIYTVNEQAERVEELEQQNKRYREAIEKIKNKISKQLEGLDAEEEMQRVVELSELMTMTIEALEGEE